MTLTRRLAFRSAPRRADGAPKLTFSTGGRSDV